ncbi:hypothetical protein ABMA28_013927 [Loxostege sticticalis]|uniref:Uncharacterized protein n=1 Tax=Loxostege sticticalis TaxID=481309 RepID=A0ABD0TJZ1_LOXSC
MFRSPVRLPNPTPTRVSPPTIPRPDDDEPVTPLVYDDVSPRPSTTESLAADCASAANHNTVTKIKDLLARINEAIKTSVNLRRNVKKEVFNSTKEIEDLLMVNPSIAPPTQPDPSATAADVNQVMS